jgi:outer membrane receptor protein involved in Fe transport
VQTLIDRKVYTVTDDVQASFGALSDILTAIPSVDVDPDGNLTLRGDSNVLILVDGKPSPLFSGSKAGDNLQSFPAKDIERIEVLTTPPPQYRAAGAAGVINIVTRKRQAEGAAGSLQASKGEGGRSVVGADGGYRAGGLSVSLSAGYRHDFRERLLASDVRSPLTPPGQQEDSTSVLSEQSHREVPSASARVDYALDERNSLNGSFSWLRRGGPRAYALTDTTTGAAGTVSSATERLSHGHDPNTDYDERLGYVRKLAHPGEALEISLHRATSQQIERYDYTNESFIPAASAHDSYLILRENHATSELGVDYVLPFTTARVLKLGYLFEQDDYRYGNTGGDVDPVTGLDLIDPTVSHEFKVRQQIHAGYASYQAGIGPWSFVAGARVERTGIDAQLLTDATASSQHYLGLFPSLHVERSVSDAGTLSLGASRRVTRPDPSNLDPYVDHEYAPNLSSGNANLKPEYSQAYEVGYGTQTHGQAWQATVYYRRNRDTVTDVTQYLGGGVSLTTKDNLPHDAAAGLELTSDGHIGERLSYSLSANLFHAQIDASALGFSDLKSTDGVNAKLKLDYRATPHDAAQISVTRTDRRLTPQGYIGALNIVNVGYRHQLRSDLTALVTVSDAFNGQRVERLLTTPTFTGEYLREVRGRIAFVGMVYSFGARASTKQPGFQYDGP